jgi:peptidoglycan/xylan/chitin deacetylase (PgdA/CDA1 family)
MAMTHRKKQVVAAGTLVFVTAFVVWLFPLGDRILRAWRNHDYAYAYSLPGDLIVEEVSEMLPAQAVPVLMYHGVIAGRGELGDNIERKNFIAQMEMLKRKGYETISVAEYDLFREGEFVLPPKPIIITFDDGRKDSFYTVDEVLKKLGYKATMFVATIKANEEDPFYLSWEELRNVQATGRWEIEAHGRHSHEEVLIDEEGTEGMYLVSREYVSGQGLEGLEEYKKRVEADYVNGINDIKDNLGIESRYYAIPLNDYGFRESHNYEDAYEYNQRLTAKYFRLAFSQVVKEGGVATQSFYNFSDARRVGLKRLEVGNVGADKLLESLDKFVPELPGLVYEDGRDGDQILDEMRLLYGEVEVERGVELASGLEGKSSARVLFGEDSWRNYGVWMRLVREEGYSVSVVVYYKDEDNYLVFDWGGQKLRLIERVGGKERLLSSYYPWEGNNEGEVRVVINDQRVTVSFDGFKLAHGLPVRLTSGAVGFGVWDADGGARSAIKGLKVMSCVDRDCWDDLVDY